MRASQLAILDGERRLSGSVPHGSGLVREWSPDGSECRIVFADLSPSQLAVSVHEELAKARDGGYALEWKVYGHDRAAGLTEMLSAAGFEAGDVETVLICDLDTFERHRFDGPNHETRTVHDDHGLVDVAAISQQLGRKDVEGETNTLRAMLRERPETLSIHVAYLDGEPVSCGRIHFGHSRNVAELAGGRTVPAHRNRGLYGAVTGARLREAAARGCRYVFVDALPTSEPILAKLGFAVLTTTQPFTYR